jgi:hypothetical protein
MFQTQLLSAIGLSLLFSLSAMAQTSTYSGATGAYNNDTWNNAANWDNGIPAGTVDAVIAAGEYVGVGSGDTPSYTGNLYIEAGAGLLIGQSSAADDLNAFGTDTIIMKDGTRLTNRHGNLAFSQKFNILGKARVNGSESSAAHHTTLNFNDQISGVGTMTFYSVNNNTFSLNASNSFEGLIVITNGSSTLIAGSNYAFGEASVLVDNGSTLVINSSLFEVMSDRAELFLNGSHDSGYTNKVVLNSSEKVGTLTIDGESKVAGTWGAPGSGATYQTNTFAGAGILTVRWNQVPAPGMVVTLR